LGKEIKPKDFGQKSAQLNVFFLDYLKEFHIPTAFVNRNSANSILNLKHRRIPFSIKILNTLDKRTAKIFNHKEGEILNLPIFEYHYGGNKDSIITESHIVAFDLCSIEDLRLMTRICSKINAVLRSFFERRNLILSELSCVFGKNSDKFFLVEDFSPQSLKVISLDKNLKLPDPYKLTTPSDVKKYSDFLINLLKN
jgi:phosphoribosylaminoimidazole-succinocarboxamide synthase